MLSRPSTMPLKKSTPRRRRHYPPPKTFSRHYSQVSPAPLRSLPVAVDTWARLRTRVHDWLKRLRRKSKPA
jgi:hypothetical protein